MIPVFLWFVDKMDVSFLQVFCRYIQVSLRIFSCSHRMLEILCTRFHNHLPPLLSLLTVFVILCLFHFQFLFIHFLQNTGNFLQSRTRSFTRKNYTRKELDGSRWCDVTIFHSVGTGHDSQFPIQSFYYPWTRQIRIETSTSPF